MNNDSLRDSLEETLNTIRERREDATQHEKLLEKIGEIFRQLSDPSQHKVMQAEESASTPAWMPPHGKGSVMDHNQSSSKIRKVRAMESRHRNAPPELRNSWPGRIYTNHLKRYGLVRRAVLWGWRNGYPIYVNHLSTFLHGKGNKWRWRQLVKLGDYAKRNGVSTCKLMDSAIVDMPEPKVFPVSDQGYLVAPHDRYAFPEIFVATIRDAMIYGGTNLVLKDSEVICHDLYDFERDYTSEELHGRTLIDPKFKRIRWMLHDHAPEPIPVAATFVDACATNYAHWMTEVLPRIVLFCAEERFHGVPIVVNDGLHKNIMESLLLVGGPDREIIILPIGRGVAVGELYVTSVTGYVPFDRRTKKLSGHSHGMFSPQALERLRNHLNALVQKTEEEAWPEKIFLRRNSGTRKVINAAEIEKLLIARGYVIVESEKLTFLQQIQLFKNAKEIISSTGAALANAICCKPGAQVVVLMSKHEDMIYRYWCDMLMPLQIKVSYVLGNIVENHDLGIHGDFAIDVDCLNDLFESFGNK